MNHFNDNSLFKINNSENSSNTNINETQNFTDNLKLHQNQFNKLIEQAMDINSFSQQFDVTKYLPKDDLYSSKILRKYKNYLDKSTGSNNMVFNNYVVQEQNEILNTNKQIIQQQNSISEIPNESYFDADSKFELYLQTDNNKRNDNNIDNDLFPSQEEDKKVIQKEPDKIEIIEDNKIIKPPFFEVYIEEVDYEERKKDVHNYISIEEEETNDIDKLNSQLMKENIKDSKINQDNFQWYCMDYSNDNDTNIDEIAKQFIDFEI